MAPSLLFITAVLAVFAPFQGGISEDGALFFSEIQQPGCEDFFTSGAVDPTDTGPISNALLDDIWDKVKKIPDLPKEILGAILDAIFYVINEAAHLVISVVGFLEDTIYSALTFESSGSTSLQITATIILAFLRVLFLMALVRIWVWILEVIPVI